MSNPLEILTELIDFIEDNEVKDELSDDGDGHTDEWRSNEFNDLISRAKKTIAKGDVQ